MNYSSCTYGFSGVSTSIASYSKISLNTLEQILSIRKLAFIDRKKWDIESYQGSDYEWDEYDDPDAIYIYAHENDRVTGCVRLRPSSKPTLMSGPLSFILPTEKTRPHLGHCWEATRFALSANNFPTGKLTRANVDIRTAALFLSMIKFAQQQKFHAYEIVVDTLMEKILKRSGWPIERLNTSLGSKGEHIIYGTLPCTLKTYNEVLSKNAINRATVLTTPLMTHRSSDTLHKSLDIAQILPARNIPAKIPKHTELQL
ncbi:acyl-homoserine-lactone synthase [Pseudomonas sp. NFACC37-1]|uniref:acyl-homoserine-lactone synthase n=1 Tax=Pseudomonas sp. NFACC37-1 TaxID=1566196 RepID=UPI00088762C6|nr:acyl-homoserine-lactone synthase [Pseudomonas sp. NFACC37-1]SCX85995.1 N-acyl-L-homoserine lactone synthetase [Pseudomonas sp. NFACC37-1]